MEGSDANSITKSSCSRFFARLFSRARPATLQDRMELAKVRWRQCTKLRLMLRSIIAAREEQEKMLMHPYFGLVKEDLGENVTKKWVIYPGTILSAVIESIVAGLILYFCLVVPYRIGFFSDEGNRKLRPLDLAFDGVLFLYLILNFFKAFIEDIEVVNDRWQIAMRYFRTHFFPDLIACLPLYALNANFLWLKLLRLLRVGQVSGLLENLIDFISKTPGKAVMDWQTKYTIIRILQFLLYLILICHIIACGWHFVAITEGVPLEETWMQGIPMNDMEAYVVSLYWVVVTFSTVGYGDITPKTDVELAYAMVVQFIGILFFAYLVGSVSSIVSNMNKRELALSKRENDLEKWLMMLDKNRPDKRLQPSLHAAIRNYFLYIWKFDHSLILSNSPFFMSLPSALRRELALVLFRDEVEKFGAFTYQCDEEFAYSVVLNMYPRKFKRLEIIIPEGTMTNELVFIDSGSILINTNRGSTTIIKLSEGGFVGDFEIVFNVLLDMGYQ